jgi:F0F1-type ATP synthase delta subunit
MKTSRTRIAKTIAARTLAGDVPKDYARELAAYLLAEGRVDELDSLMRDVQADWAKQGYVEVIARSAHALSSETKADITKRVQEIYPTANKIVVTEVADPEVVGGVRLSLAGQQLDLSVEAKLNKFKQLTGAGKE